MKEDAPELIGVGAESLVKNANRLGLTWRLTPGTVSDDSPLTVVQDGDEEPIGAVSLIGTLVAAERVMILTVPPSGKFVIGRPEGSVISAFASLAPNGIETGSESASLAPNGIETGSESFTFILLASTTVAVTFPVPMPTVPRVFTNIASTTAVTVGWNSRAINVTATGFTLWVGALLAASWTGIEVQWLAVAT